MKNAIIIHGTEGNPEENWFPWLKKELEQKGYTVSVPQFPSPPVVPAKISEWFDVLNNYQINEDTIIIGHSLGGIFTLRVLETLNFTIKAAILVGTPIGIKPIKYYERDLSFSGFEFNWSKIKNVAKDFVVFQSDNDPYVALENGRELSNKLGVTLYFIPNAGHFNAQAGYTEFPELLQQIKKIEHNFTR
ncbi:MAG: serine hydrolase family protein [Bacilli bacterium]|nr:serine hydrolase family protein [Bacilli bacterium]